MHGCVKVPEWQDDTQPPTFPGSCAFLVHISLLMNPKGKLLSYTCIQCEKAICPIRNKGIGGAGSRF